MSDQNDQRPPRPSVPPVFPAPAAPSAPPTPATPSTPPTPSVPQTPQHGAQAYSLPAQQSQLTQQQSQQAAHQQAQPQAYAPSAAHQAFTTPGFPPGAPPVPNGSAFGPAAVTQEQPAAPAAKRPRKSVGSTIALLAATVVIAAAAGFGGSWAFNTYADNGPRPSNGDTGGVITVNNPGSVTQTTAIAAQVLPSVVTINVSTDKSGGSGSGVILSEDGYVLTNTHVVTLDGATGAAEVSVTTSDGRIFTAEVVGTDPTYDLAVIKLKNATDLTPVTWGDSTKLNVGDATVALGAPLGLSNTVTEGIVSNLNRSIQVASSAAPDTGDTTDGGDANNQGGPFTFDVPGQQSTSASEYISMAVIQTDAAINPGNSGGALVNGKGELIGINVAIATAGGTSGTAGSIGVGFSIPSSIAQRISQEIIDTGKATHGLLGASVSAASNMKGATHVGAYIASVIDGGAAQTAGLAQGDVVTMLGSSVINDATDLTAQVRALAAGAATTLTYLRDGKSYETDVTLGAL